MADQFVLYKALVIVALASALEVNGIQINTTILGDSVKGDSATVVCSWEGTEGKIGIVTILSVDDGTYYEHRIGNDLQPTPGHSNPRISVDTTTIISTNVTMRIRSVSCSDEKPYICQLLYYSDVTGTGNTPQRSTKESAKNLTVKVRPGYPTITTTPERVTSGVPLNSQIEFKCRAITGRKGTAVGHLVWRLTTRDKSGAESSEVISAPDPRLKSGYEPNPPGEEKCVEHSYIVLTLNVSRAEHGLVIACYVLNQEFNISLPSNVSCGNIADILCDKIGPLRVFFSSTTTNAATSTSTTTATTFPPASQVHIVSSLRSGTTEISKVSVRIIRSDAASDDDDDDSGVIIGLRLYPLLIINIIFLVVIAILAGAAWLARRRQRKKEMGDAEKSSNKAGLETKGEPPKEPRYVDEGLPDQANESGGSVLRTDSGESYETESEV